MVSCHFLSFSCLCRVALAGISSQAVPLYLSANALAASWKECTLYPLSTSSSSCTRPPPCCSLHAILPTFTPPHTPPCLPPSSARSPGWRQTLVRLRTVVNVGLVWSHGSTCPSSAMTRSSLPSCRAGSKRWGRERPQDLGPPPSPFFRLSTSTTPSSSSSSLPLLVFRKQAHHLHVFCALALTLLLLWRRRLGGLLLLLLLLL